MTNSLTVAIFMVQEEEKDTHGLVSELVARPPALLE